MKANSGVGLLTSIDMEDQELLGWHHLGVF